jgi:SpoVK/Ycf46/Vps4 family AAA+-type ATPase
MLKRRLSGIPCCRIDYERVADLCEGFSGAEIELVCEKAKQSVIRAIIGGASSETKICEKDLIEAIQKIRESK